jgi:hypothetical protein
MRETIMTAIIFLFNWLCEGICISAYHWAIKSWKAAIENTGTDVG